MRGRCSSAPIFRFVPERNEAGDLIVDSRPSASGSRRQAGDRAVAEAGDRARPYALVSRVFDRATGTLVVSGAGIAQCGTRPPPPSS